jgi:hypothetical protein
MVLLKFGGEGLKARRGQRTNVHLLGHSATEFHNMIHWVSLTNRTFLLSGNVNIRIYKVVVLYDCETWSLALREEHRVLENRVLRRIFGRMRDEVTRGRRKLHNEDLRDLYSSPTKIRMMTSRRMRWAGHVGRMGEKRNAYRLLVGKIPLRRPKRR